MSVTLRTAMPHLVLILTLVATMDSPLWAQQNTIRSEPLLIRPDSNGVESPTYPTPPTTIPGDLGVHLDPRSDRYAVVTSVDRGSIAERAGVQASDVIHELNGAIIVGPSDYLNAVQRLNSGDDIRFTISRVLIAKAPPNSIVSAAPGPGIVTSVPAAAGAPSSAANGNPQATPAARQRREAGYRDQGRPRRGYFFRRGG